MRHPALQQALYFPFGAMLFLALFGLAVPGYHTLSQHMSELGLLAGWPARVVQAMAAISGASILIFSMALLGQGRRFAFTALTSSLFGVCMLSNGLFTTGSPLHGMYGIGMFSVLTPLLFLSELGGSASVRMHRVSRWIALIGMVYLWMMVCGLDPAPYRGLTQRLAALPAFAWYALAVLELRTRVDA